MIFNLCGSCHFDYLMVTLLFNFLVFAAIMKQAFSVINMVKTRVCMQPCKR